MSARMLSSKPRGAAEDLYRLISSEAVMLRAPFFAAAVLGGYSWSFGWLLVVIQAYISFLIAPRRVAAGMLDNATGAAVLDSGQWDPLDDDDATRWPKCNHSNPEPDPFELVMAESDPRYQSEGLLRIFEISANHLAKQDLFGKSDPYVELYLADEKGHATCDKCRTRVIHQTLNPEWDSMFVLEVPSKEGAFLVADVWDFNKMKASDFLGRIQIPVSDLPDKHHR